MFTSVSHQSYKEAHLTDLKWAFRTRCQACSLHSLISTHSLFTRNARACLFQKVAASECKPHFLSPSCSRCLHSTICVCVLPTNIALFDSATPSTTSYVQNTSPVKLVGLLRLSHQRTAVKTTRKTRRCCCSLVQPDVIRSHPIYQ